MPRDDLQDWGRRLDAELTEDPLLELAARLREGRPEAPPPPAGFKNRLRARLLAQHEAQNRRLFGSGWRQVFSYAGMAILAVVLVLGIRLLLPGTEPQPGIISTQTALPSSTETTLPTYTMTPTIEVFTPGAPILAKLKWENQSGMCQKIQLSWMPNEAWETSLLSSLSYYLVYVDGAASGIISPEDSSPTIWDTGLSLKNSDTRTLSVKAYFAGSVTSLALEVEFQCVNGELEIDE